MTTFSEQSFRQCSAHAGRTTDGTSNAEMSVAIWAKVLMPLEDRPSARLEVLALRRWIGSETEAFLLEAWLDVPIRTTSLRVVRFHQRVERAIEKSTKQFLKLAGEDRPLTEDLNCGN